MKARILVVDDDPDVRQTLAVLLAAHQLFCADSGEEALRTLAREQPEVMLLDLSLPGLSGLDVLRAAAEASPKTAVVMLTGQADIEVAKSALQLGAVSFVTKPWDDAFLLAEVERLVQAGSGETEPYRPWRLAP